MSPDEQHVSTEAQRLALEAMSAELVHKLNLMIQEQEERARAFAASHQSSLPSIPRPAQPEATVVPAAPARPAPPAWATPAPRKAPAPIKQTAPNQEEESNIGMGMVIFSLIGIIMLIRSCT